MFPRLEELCGKKVTNTPLLEAQVFCCFYLFIFFFQVFNNFSLTFCFLHAQHHALLARTETILTMLRIAPKTDAQRSQLVADLIIEYKGWARVLLDHLAEEERICIPLFLLLGHKY